jgi:hypothetical protein
MYGLMQPMLLELSMELKLALLHLAHQPWHQLPLQAPSQAQPLLLEAMYPLMVEQQ